MLREGYMMLLVALTPPDAQKPGRAWPPIKSSFPNPFFFLLSYSALFCCWFICRRVLTKTENNTTCQRQARPKETEPWKAWEESKEYKFTLLGRLRPLLHCISLGSISQHFGLKICTGTDKTFLEIPNFMTIFCHKPKGGSKLANNICLYTASFFFFFSKLANNISNTHSRILVDRILERQVHCREIQSCPVCAKENLITSSLKWIMKSQMSLIPL